MTQTNVPIKIPAGAANIPKLEIKPLFLILGCSANNVIPPGYSPLAANPCTNLKMTSNNVDKLNPIGINPIVAVEIVGL